MLEPGLEALAQAIRKKVEAYRQTPLIRTRRVVHVRRRDFSLQYVEDYGFANLQPQRIEKEIWEPENQSHFQDVAVKALPEYEQLLSEIDPDKITVLEQFVRVVCGLCFQGRRGAELANLVMKCGRELAGEPLPVRITAFLNGVSIGEPSIVISPEITLRKPNPEDMVEAVMLDEYGGFSFPLGNTLFRAVGEFCFEATSSGVAQMTFLRCIATFHLYAVAGVTAGRYFMSSDHSFLGGGRTVLGQATSYSRFNHSLTSSESVGLGAFLRDISPLLPDPLSQATDIDYKQIALNRYKDALFYSAPLEQSVTLAISSLEALFLEGNAELTHRLSQRVSLFLRVLGSHPDAIKTYQNVSAGYGIRSKFIHGGRAKEPGTVETLAPIVLDYARVSTLAFFQLRLSKAELLAQLDRAMIDPDALSAVHGSLADVRYR